MSGDDLAGVGGDPETDVGPGDALDGLVGFQHVQALPGDHGGIGGTGACCGEGQEGGEDSQGEASRARRSFPRARGVLAVLTAALPALGPVIDGHGGDSSLEATEATGRSWARALAGEAG